MGLRIQIQVSCNASQAPYSLYSLLSLAPFFPHMLFWGDWGRNIGTHPGIFKTLVVAPPHCSGNHMVLEVKLRSPACQACAQPFEPALYAFFVLIKKDLGFHLAMGGYV